jgi:hypothetical protein
MAYGPTQQVYRGQAPSGTGKRTVEKLNGARAEEEHVETLAVSFVTMGCAK